MRPFFRSSRPGLSLVEVLVALGLTAFCLMFVLAVLPLGIRAARQAARTQTATAWSRHLLETCPPTRQVPIPDALARVELRTVQDGVLYEAVRTISPISPYVTQIEVETTWSGASEPLKLVLIRFESESAEAAR